MSDKELLIAEKILEKNHINGSPSAFWESKEYYDIAYMTASGNFFRKRFRK